MVSEATVKSHINHCSPRPAPATAPRPSPTPTSTDSPEPAPRHALAAAVAVQRAVGTEPWPPGAPVRVRVALHSGVCVELDGEYVDVDWTARLLAVSHGGQVLVSGGTRELLANRLPGGIGLRDLGEHRLKDLDPVPTRARMGRLEEDGANQDRRL